MADREPKTLFEHIGGLIGSDKKKGEDILTKYKGTIKTFIFMVAVGFITGVMIDVYAGTSTYTTIMPLLMCLLFLVKWYKGSNEKIKGKK